MTASVVLRPTCPPGACICGLEQLLSSTADTDQRILRLTRAEEKKLLERLKSLRDLDDLRHMQQRMSEQLGLQMDINPGFGEVRSARGIQIQVHELPGLCRKTRKAIPSAIRYSLNANPEILYRLLDEYDLFGMHNQQPDAPEAPES